MDINVDKTANDRNFRKNRSANSFIKVLLVNWDKEYKAEIFQGFNFNDSKNTIFKLYIFLNIQH